MPSNGEIEFNFRFY